MHPGLITNIWASLRRVDITFVLVQSLSRLRLGQTSQKLLSTPSTSTRINQNRAMKHLSDPLLHTMSSSYVLLMLGACFAYNINTSSRTATSIRPSKFVSCRNFSSYNMHSIPSNFFVLYTMSKNVLNTHGG
jgi:hypothetical protein